MLTADLVEGVPASLVFPVSVEIRIERSDHIDPHLKDETSIVKAVSEIKPGLGNTVLDKQEETGLTILPKVSRKHFRDSSLLCLQTWKKWDNSVRFGPFSIKTT